MATTATATLNGGPRGGLHTTTLLRSDEPQQDETCRMDSNSSFDSGQDENQGGFGGGGGGPGLEDAGGWSNYNSKSSFDLDNNQGFSDGNNKKRRKQSRPVRIPASELPENRSNDPRKRPGRPMEAGIRVPGDGREDFPAHQAGGTHSARTKAGESSRLAGFSGGEENESGNDNEYEPRRYPNDIDDHLEEEEEDEDEEGLVHRGGGGRRRDCGGNDGQILQSMFLKKSKRSHSATPLNLSNKLHGEDSLDGSLERKLAGRGADMGSSLHFKMTSSIDNDKTEVLPGQGTKDFHRNSNPSFSPGLFPLLSSSPFFSFVPQNPQAGSSSSLSSALQLGQSGGTSQQQQTSATHSSSSSNSSNLLQSSSSHQQFNTNNNNNNNNNMNNKTNATNNPSNNNNNNNGNSSTSVSLSGNMQNIPPHRIFNPEAYCDLCNKEFCNKYFLKTHKANKHGVYSENTPTSSSSGGNIPSSSQVMAAAAAALSITSSQSGSFLGNPPANLLCSTLPLPGSGSQQHVGPPPPVQQPANMSSSLSGMSGKNSSPLDGPSIPMTLGSLGMESSKGPGSNSSSSQTREAFCDLCQKEFCNKYFLKRHKAKIHGIPLDTNTGSGSNPGSSSGGRSSKNSSQATSRQNFSNGLNSDKGNMNPDLVDDRRNDHPNKHVEESSGSMEEGEVNSSRNLHSSELDNMAGGQMKFSKESRRSSSPESESQQNFSRDRREGGSSCIADGEEDVGGRGGGGGSGEEEKMEMKISSLPAHLKLPLGLPQLGLGNVSETTCQYCFREFANKSLLRTHINKKHRLLLPTFPPFLLPFQAMGSNIFEEAQAGGGGDLRNAGLDPDNFEQGEGKEETDYGCNICGRSFQTVYLLRMHKSYLHPDSEDMSDITAAAAAAVTKMEESSDVDDSDHNRTPTPRGGPDHIRNSSERERAGVGTKVEAETGGEENEEDETEAEATSDSDDLRRLQTMIMELNRVSSAAAAAAASSSWSPTLESNLGGSGHCRSPGGLGNPAFTFQNNNTSVSTCHLCSKEFYSAYFLQQHIQHYHMGNADLVVKSESPDLGSRKITENLDHSSSSSPVSKSMGKERSKDGALRDGANSDNNFTAFSASASSFLTPGPKTSGSNPSSGSSAPLSNGAGNKTDASGKRPSPSLSRSYCTICHKELCNKYFMRTHMLKMHGISIESSTGLGGVTCDICNKELCSKYFLKVHKQNTHGIVDDGPSPPNPSTPGPVPLSLLPGSSPSELGVNLSPGGTELVPLLANSPVDLQSRYFSHYSEVCPFCGRRFRSAKWLKTHLMTDHGQEGKDRWKAIEKTLQHHPSSVSSSGGGSGNKRQGKSNPGGTTGSSNTGSGGGTGSKGGGGKSSGSSKQGSMGMKGSGGGGGGSGSLFPLASANGSNGNKCALCGFLTPDMEVMKVHLIKDHATQLAGADPGAGNSNFPDPSRMLLDPLTLLFQKMEGGTNKIYRCSYCPFSTSLLVYLYAHERTHTGLGNAISSGGGGGGSGAGGALPGLGLSPEGGFQCPMCFHTFQQVETFQQHLIGHQMSGVLAPFFNPPSSNPAALHSALGTPDSGNEPHDAPGQHLPFSALSLPLLNGVVGPPGAESFYWALKNSQNGSSSLDDPPQQDDNQSNEPSSPVHNEERSIKIEAITSGKLQLSPRDECEKRGDERASTLQGHHGASGPSTHGNTARSKRVRERVIDEEEEDDENENDETLLLSRAGKACGRKRGKINSFRCFYCQMAFKSRPECSAHIQQSHSEEQKKRRKIKTREKRNFRCRKCKFSTNQYQTLVVHNRVHHSLIRGYHFEKGEKKGRFGLLNWNKDSEEVRSGEGGTPWNLQGLPLGRAVPQEGVSGDYLMQGFLLFCSADEESGGIGSGSEKCKNYKLMESKEGADIDQPSLGTAPEDVHLPEDKEDDIEGCKELMKSHHNNNYNCSPSIQSSLFIPSLVYLPVREKVSQSVRVSFSLTPTS